MNEFDHGTNGGWTKYENNPVLGGKYGTCFDISMLTANGLIYMYFSWRDRKNISVTTSIDGVNWSEPQTCIEPCANGREYELNRPYVLYREGLYHMWYTGQYKPGQPDGRSYVFYASGTDGVHFKRRQADPVLSAELPWEKEAVMCPSVLWDDDKQVYRMWYSGGEQYEPNAIGYAVSSDGITWEKYAKNPVFQADPDNPWEQHKTTACQVIKYRGEYLMFYIGFRNENYAQIGMACSADGISGWERSKLNPIIAPDEGKWDSDACYKPFVLFADGEWKLWYNGRRGSKEQIGMAVLRSPDINF